MIHSQIVLIKKEPSLLFVANNEKTAFRKRSEIVDSQIT